MTPFGKGNLVQRIDRATDIILESMARYDSQTCRDLVIDALYLLMEGKPRPKGDKKYVVTPSEEE